MTAAAESTVTFDGRFARELAELAVPWQAEEAPSPELLVLNGKLATDLGLDPQYLRSPEGVRLLVGNHVPAGATPVAQAYASLVGIRPCSATDGPCCWARSLTGPAASWTSISKVRGERPSPARGTAVPWSGPCCVST